MVKSARHVRDPMETEFIFITANDIHISDINPRSRIDNFKTTILNKLAQMRMACNKLNADGAIIAGDLYNLKNPSRNSHNLNKELIKEFKQFNCPIYMIEGNHDLTADRLDSIKEQPLGVLFEDGTLIQLRQKIVEKNNIKVSLIGIPYIENVDLSDLNIPEKNDCITQIGVMHLYASLKPGMLYRERLYGYDELALLSPDIFVLGHYHVDQGIYENNNKYFINIGSLSRGAISEEDIKHHPQIGFIKIHVKNNTPSYTLRTIQLKVKPIEEIFDLEKKKEEEKERQEIQFFVDKLAAETLNNEKDNSKNIDDLVDKMNITKEVKNRVMSFIQEAVTKK